MNKINVCQKCKLQKECLVNSRRQVNTGKIRYNYLCKECNNEKSKKYRLTEKGRISIYKTKQKQWEKNSERMHARRFLAYHVRLGYIKRPDNCSKCNSLGKIEGHHTDYTKPLEVVWLCRNCHWAETANTV